MAISSRCTKGITIELGGNSTKLKSALDEANRSIRTTQSELDTLKNSLKLEWNAEQFKRAQELAQRAIEQTAQKVETLKKALASMGDEGKFSDTQREQYEALRRELSYVEVSAQKAREELESLGNLRLEDIRKTLDNAASNLNNLGNKLTMGLTVPLAAAGTAAFNYASDTDEALNKVEVAFGTAADGVKSWSDTTLNSIGLAKGTALDMAALYGDMSTSMGIADESAAGMSKTLVNLAADLASFKNISIEQANTALKSIFTGETESLKGLGIVMTQTNLEAYAMAEGFKTAYKDMDQAQQVMVRYQYVLAQTKNAQGDFSRTSDGAANQVRILQESLKEAAATAGDDLLPVITPIITNLNGLIQGFGDLDEGTRKVIVQTGLFVAALGPALKLTGGITTAVTAGITVYQSLTAAQTAATTAQTGLNAAMSANPIGAVVTAVGALVAVLTAAGVASALAGNQQEDYSKKVKQSAESVKKATKEIRDDTQEKLANLEAVRKLLPEIDALNSKSGRTQEEQDRLNALVSTANSLYPDLIGKVNELTGSYDVNSGAIEDNIAALKRRIQAEAAQSEAEVQYREAAKLRLDLVDSEQDLDKAIQNATMSQQVLNETIEEGGAAAKSPELLQIALKEAADEVNRTKQAVADLKQQIAEYESKAGGYIDTTVAFAKAEDGAASSAQGMGKAVDGAAGSAGILSGILSDGGDRLEDLVSGLDKAAKSYGDVADAQEMGTSTALKLQVEYANLVAENADLLAQYPELYAALDDNNTIQENSAEIAKSVWSIKRQLLAQELQAQIDNINKKIETYEAEKNAAVEAYATIARASMFASNTSLEDRYKPLGGKSLVGELLEQYGGEAQAAVDSWTAGEEAALSNLKQQQAALTAQLDDLLNTDVTKYKVGGSGTKKSGGKKSGTKTEDPGKAALDELDAWLEDMDHEIFLWSKDGQKTQAVVGLYQQMQDKIHALAEAFRAKGYGEESDEIQKLQKLWWGYSDEQGQLLQEMYERELTALREALEAEKLTREEYFASLQALQDKYFQEGTEAWRTAEEQRRQEVRRVNQAAYDQELSDNKYFKDMGLISEEEYYARLSALRDKYLEENSEEWRRANVELHSYLEQRRQEELRAAEEAYNAQADALKKALDERLAAAKDAYSDELDALKQAYGEQKDAAKAAYSEKKAQIQAELDLEKKRLNAVIDGIDAEIQARRALREDEDQDDAIAKARKRLEAAEAEVAYARTPEDAEELKKEAQRLREALEQAIQDKEDTAFYREKELEKEAVKEQITAAEEKAKGEQSAAQGAYDEQLKRLEADYDASVEKVKADYEASVRRLEAEYGAALDRLERRKEEQAGSGGSALDPEVLAIAKANNVSYSDARDMRDANRRNEGNPNAPHYSDGGYSERAASAGKALAGIVGAVTSAGTSVLGGAVSNIVNHNNRSASVTVNSGGAPTEGQLARTVEKVLSKLGR